MVSRDRPTLDGEPAIGMQMRCPFPLTEQVPTDTPNNPYGFTQTQGFTFGAKARVGASPRRESANAAPPATECMAVLGHALGHALGKKTFNIEFF